MQLAALLLVCLQAGIALAQEVTVTQYASTITVEYSPAQPTTLATSTLPTTVVKVAAQSATADGSSNTVDTDAGASGSSTSSFQLSSGAIIAIIVVCVLVVIFGIASTILFVIAKRRQWNVRASIARASRRLTGRSGGARTRQQDVEASRRTGTYFGTPQRPGIKAVMPPGHKRGLVVNVQAQPQKSEKRPGPLDGKAPANTRPREKTWMKNLWGNGWK